MIPLYEDLIGILEKEFALCIQMVELLQREKAVIVALDHKTLENLLRDKQAVTEKIRLCDERRERILDGLGFKNKTISEIAEVSEEEYRDRVREIASRFKSVIGSITELNKFNSLLIEKSLYYLKTSYSFLNTFDIIPKQKVSVEA